MSIVGTSAYGRQGNRLDRSSAFFISSHVCSSICFTFLRLLRAHSSSTSLRFGMDDFDNPQINVVSEMYDEFQTHHFVFFLPSTQKIRCHSSSQVPVSDSVWYPVQLAWLSLWYLGPTMDEDAS